MYKNILIPLDFDHEGGAEQAIAVARLLADTNATCTVIHVMEEVPGYVRGQISEDTLTKRHKALQDKLDHAAAGLSGAMTELVSGHAGQTIVNYAAEHDVDCIVLLSHTPELKDFFIGSTANRVVHYAPCAVHVIR